MNLPYGSFATDGFDSLESLADALSEGIRCPVTIEDANHRLLAYSLHDMETDPARIATIIGRRVPERIINSLWKHGIMQALQQTDEPIRIPAIHEVGLGSRVAVSIRKNAIILGYIWVLELDRALSNEQLDLLRKAVPAVKGKLLQLQQRKRKQEEGEQEFFWRLLTGGFSSSAQVKEKAAQAQLILPDTFQIVIFQFPSEIQEDVYQHIRSQLANPSPVRTVCHVTDRDQFILMTGLLHPDALDDTTVFAQEFIRRVSFYPQLQPIIAGAGRPYRGDCTMAEASYREALEVLRVRKLFPNETAASLHYSELGFYLHLPFILEGRNRQLPPNPHLVRLAAYDREHGTELLPTLEAYLASDCSMKAASERLHIHTNTLAYRLARITEVGKINLKDADQKVSIYIDLKLRRLLPPPL